MHGETENEEHQRGEQNDFPNVQEISSSSNHDTSDLIAHHVDKGTAINTDL